MRKINCIQVLTLAFLIGCSTTDNQVKDDSNDIETIRKLIAIEYTTAVNSHDTTAYVKLFCDDVIWAPPNAPVAKSKSEIKKNLQLRFDMFEFNLSIIPSEIKILSNYAYALADADLNLKPRNGEPEINAKITAIWILKKTNEEWKFYRQLYNSKG